MVSSGCFFGREGVGLQIDFDYWRHYARARLWRFFGREEKAFVEYRKAFRRQPDDVQSARHLACIAADRKRYEVADKWFIESLRLVPADADTHYNHGFVLEQAGRPHAAIAAFAEAVRLQPALDHAWYGMGLAYAHLGEHAAAADAFARAVELQPMHGDAYYLWGMACHQAGQSEQVEEIVERLLGFDSKLAARLVRDAGRQDDLGPLIPELPF
ncbi:tetratricopeptide repeat protein [Accumulibacter sp.]|uniref:tetratricopeptide repeat protein n=1 Tax=Accumulibacter sp. TaxID=2053492 RepID=UPI0028C510D8|nr:tetratricopeptide repeat protein [Accumulibacter sp.]